MEFLSLQETEAEAVDLIGSPAHLHTERNLYQPKVPEVLSGKFSLQFTDGTTSYSDPDVVKQLFPSTYGQPGVIFVPELVEIPDTPKVARKLRVGCVFSGGPAPGGHNVVAGLFDFLTRENNGSELFGFLGGPSGIVEKIYRQVTETELENYRNIGGFHYLGSGRTKIETAEQLKRSVQTCVDLELDGLVIIGGDDSNTNAAVLAEYFLKNDCKTCVVGIPKTIDGDLKNTFIESSFGFDTATKFYANQTSNICLDAISACKAYHFIRIMGRDASHITLEVALQTHPNLVFISEEYMAKHAKKSITLMDVVNEILHLILERAALHKNYGVIVIPEGLITHLSDMKQLIEELNELLVANDNAAIDPLTFDTSKLSESAQVLYANLPDFILRQMMLERDPHGNVQVATIELERLIGHMVRIQLEVFREKKIYRSKFTYVCHYFGYEGRCGYPSQFDCDYCYSLGLTAGGLLENQKTSMIACIKNLHLPPSEWIVGGIPLTSMMTIERRLGHMKPVIRKQLVDLHGLPFRSLLKYRESWKLNDDYRVPGPIQLGNGSGKSGRSEELRTLTLLLEAQQRLKQQKEDDQKK
jgi:pyrophosphate--fructose-6-phosphate 1-phosphotransferase